MIKSLEGFKGMESMGLKIKNILITGAPGIGKTTLIKKLYEELRDFHPVGFYTAEIREKGIRKGFELISLDGKRGLLSHADIKSSFKVGRYSVDIDGFEGFLDSIKLEHASGIVIIDEIGKMECLSQRFRTLIRGILNSQRLVIATIALKGSGIIVEIKRRDDIRLFEMTKSNREPLLSGILKDVKRLLW